MKDDKLQQLSEGGLYHWDYKQGVHDLWVYLGANPAFAYAAEHWASHLSQIGVPDPHLFSQAMELLATQNARDALIRLNYKFRYPSRLGCPYGPSRLHIACYFNIPWLVKEYLAQNDNPDQISDAEDTPLIWASETGSFDCASQLLKAGSNPNKVEVDGWSALHWTAANGHVRLCHLLLEHGANANAEDSKKFKPLDWAKHRGHTDIVDILKGRTVEQQRRYRDMSRSLRSSTFAPQAPEEGDLGGSGSMGYASSSWRQEPAETDSSPYRSASSWTSGV